MSVRVSINGFGRIGRNIMRATLGDKNIDFVAVNDLTSAHTLAHLLKYDSVLGNLHHKVEAKADAIAVEILKRCDGKATLRAIVDDLARQFSADRTRVESDVKALLAELAAKRMVDL